MKLKCAVEILPMTCRWLNSETRTRLWKTYEVKEEGLLHYSPLSKVVVLDGWRASLDASCVACNEGSFILAWEGLHWHEYCGQGPWDSWDTAAEADLCGPSACGECQIQNNAAICPHNVSTLAESAMWSVDSIYGLPVPFYCTF